jgi:transposase, IS30 family
MENFSHLSYQERCQIYRGLCQGLSKGDIAKRLGRTKSTITREVKRNSDHAGYLYPGEAHQMALDRHNKNEPKIDKDPKLKNYIIAKLYERWSPRVIAGRWSKEHEDSPISAEAIYQWIYGEIGETLNLKKLLIRARKKRGLKRRPKQPTIKNRVSVNHRPENINQRVELGHFECDLMFNSGSQSKNICTLIERVTRNSILICNESKHTKTVVDALIEHITKTGLVVKSITFDNGSEFAGHTRLNALGIATYFCDPGAPWQKGSIENLNGVARRYVPFAQKSQEITEDYVAKINDKINNMPRAILGFKTPNEVLKESSCFV